MDRLVGHLAEQVGDAVEAGAALVVGIDHEPGAVLGIRVGEHVILGAGVLHPAGAGLQVHGAEFPALDGGVDALLEALLLLFITDREPVLDEGDARASQHPLELGAGTQKLAVFGIGAKAHYPLHPGPVVPGAIEQHHLPRRGQVGGIALEVPLGALPVRGGGQGGDPADPGVEGLGDRLDDAPLAGGIAPLEQHHHLEPLLLDPLLQLDQLLLQLSEVVFIGLLVQARAFLALFLRHDLLLFESFLCVIPACTREAPLPRSACYTAASSAAGNSKNIKPFMAICTAVSSSAAGNRR
ncbi:hypothetical protein D3C75_842260 [compost metagenome]